MQAALGGMRIHVPRAPCLAKMSLSRSVYSASAARHRAILDKGDRLPSCFSTS